MGNEEVRVPFRNHHDCRGQSEVWGFRLLSPKANLPKESRGEKECQDMVGGYPFASPFSQNRTETWPEAKEEILVSFPVEFVPHSCIIISG